ncbi:MAG: hypothetical protein GYA46_00025 [candidate division Zixibacteria bacterium]|nr:hypothetical protein [candidate division Zixibacteria bacterium]
MKKLVAWLSLPFALVIAASVSADMIVTSTATLETMGLGGTDMVITQKIKGDLGYFSVATNGKGIMAGAAQAGENIIINRLDKKVMWILSPATKTYLEYPLSTLKAMAEAGAAEAAADSTADPEYTWSITIDTLPETTINGFTCTGIKGVAEGLSVASPGERTRMIYEVWVGKNLPGNDELINHYKLMADQSGQDAYSQNEMVDQILGKGKGQLKQLADAARGLSGFPVRTAISVATSVDLGKEIDEETGDDSATAAMMEQVKAMLKGQAGEDGMTTVISLRSDVTKIEVAPVEPAVFEIPEGYTRSF